jgi:hypothetical protein
MARASGTALHGAALLRRQAAVAFGRRSRLGDGAADRKSEQKRAQAHKPNPQLPQRLKRDGVNSAA